MSAQVSNGQLRCDVYPKDVNIARKNQAELRGNQKKKKPCLVEDPAHILVRDGENPAPAFSKLVQK